MSAKTTSPYKARIKTFTIVRCAEPSTTGGDAIKTPAAALGYLLPFFRKADAGREHFGVLLLDAKHRPIAAKLLFSGSVRETPIFPREIVRAALLLGASAVVIAHNHPTGDLTPSPEDRKVTRNVADALRTLEIQLLDHLILNVEDGRFQSVGSEGDDPGHHFSMCK